MAYSITVQINSADFIGDENLHFLEMKDVFNKYNYSILTHTQDEKLVYLAKEFSALKKNIIAFNACYNLKEILYLNNELKKYNLALDTVYIPSNERIEKRKAEALENAKLHSRWLGTDEIEVENNFVVFRETLQEIKNGLKDTSINVFEC